MAIKQKHSFRTRIFISFFTAFALFTVAILLFQYDREKKFKIRELETTLDNITEFTHRFIDQNHLVESGDFARIDSILRLIPIKNERITIIDPQGAVKYDSEVKDISKMENHLHRPEIQKSYYSGHGSSIRKSATTNQSYYYYSKSYPSYFIRTAVIYDIVIKDFLKTERIFIIFILILFAIMWILLRQITSRLGDFISQLRDFAVSAVVGAEIETEPNFPYRELDVIGKKIVSIYNSLTKAKIDLVNEKEKLFQHLHVLEEGIAFYSPQKEKTLSNSHFVQYLNLISDRSTVNIPNFFEISSLKPIADFIDEKTGNNTLKEKNLLNKEITILKGERYFNIKAIVFTDNSFELLISDVTKLEKRRLLKQQLTSNIAHELKTPVTSLRGYLETILTSKDIPAEKQRYFLERAFSQSERLTELLNDISLLNNIEDAGDLFEFKEISIAEVIDEVIENLKYQLDEKKVVCNVDVSPEVKITGNFSLLSFVFHNLIENTIKYAGENIEISVRNYHEDEKHIFFSYRNSGPAIPEEHLSRIFERFYRIDEGRSRANGGTGLGLAIVKNAIALHKGEISVRNLPQGGVEFLFSLGKK